MTDATLQPVETPGSLEEAPATQPLSAPAAPRRLSERTRNQVSVGALSLAFIAAESLVFWDVRAQAVAQAVVLMVAVTVAAAANGNRRLLGVVIAGLASVRLFTTTLPFAGVSITTRTAIIGACSVLVWAIAWRLLHSDVTHAPADARPPIPSTKSWPITVAVILASVAASFGVFYLLEPAQLVYLPTKGSRGLSISLGALGLALGAAGEELLFRRLLGRLLLTNFGWKVASFAGVIWAATYLGTNNVAFIALVGVVGAIFAWSYVRTGAIWGALFGHITISILSLMVLPALL